MADVIPERANVTASGASEDNDVPINWTGVVSIVVFYLAVLAVGIWAGWKQRRAARDAGRDLGNQEDVMLAGRNVGLFVGVLTMGATWVGGGFINGSAEAAYRYGLIWVQAPFGFGFSLLISGTFFAKKMRDAKYVTMIDPFTQKYGKWGSLQAFPSAISEIFWSASILGALGSTLKVILHIDTRLSIIISAIIAVCYTLVGGLLSVAYTDVFQIAFIAFGLVLALPFAVNNPAVGSISFSETDWGGKVDSHLWAEWVDFWLLLLLGGIPWQAYFQRVLSAQTSKRAVLLSYGGCAIAVVMAVPATLFGAVAKATDWSQTEWGHQPNDKEATLVLPLCLQYLTPQWVAFFGLGAVSAAVMSSTDSSMLSASSMLARNFYGTVLRPKASDREVVVVMSVLIVINATLAATLAIVYQSVYNLFVLCGDFVYVIVFPQLLLVLYLEKANTYGSVVSYFFGLIFRLLCGDVLLEIPATITFGSFANEIDPSAPGPAPFRTIVMLISIAIHIGLSLSTDYIFTNGLLSLKYDFFRCFERTNDGVVKASGSRFLEAEEITLDDLAKKGNFMPRASIKNGGGKSPS